MKSILTITLSCVLVLCIGQVPAASAAGKAEQRAVLVTGASSGIGRRITEVLAAEGHFVYAGARKDKDLAELDAIDNVKSVRLDVTVQSDIDAAVALVKEQGRGLHGIVNNAGVAIFSPMNETPEEDLNFVFDVNVFGPYRINKAFTPLLVESKGRTTTIGSISGFISGASSGTYSMSKFAVEAYTDALAEELAGAGVHVSVVEPGNYKSRIRDKVVEHAAARAEEGQRQMSERERQRMDDIATSNDSLKEPDEVAEAVLHALFADAPKRRYMVTPNEQEAEITIRYALQRIAQLNKDQVYSYSRDELVALLEEVLEAE